MTQLKLNTQSIVIILLTTVHYISTNKPVFETINEQARIDDNVRISNSPGILPYGNPLAGNSKRNARIHANNQQAMFNAERIRQLKAQSQRWSTGPQIIDSYMKAYHESQESHQMALEQQQATLKDNPVTNAPSINERRPTRQRVVQNKKKTPNPEGPSKTTQNVSSRPTRRGQNQRQELPRRGSFFQKTEPTKITKADAVIKDARNRNHRSYGSADYHQNLEPNSYRTVYASQSPNYGQDGTTKNSNIDVTQYQEKISPKLYTLAIPSDAKQTYPKQSDNFNTVQDIKALNSLLKKSPSEQLTGFNALLNYGKNSDTSSDQPIDFFFYLTDPKKQLLNQNLDHLKYTQSPSSYASAYSQYTVKDHTPITEEVDDIEDPNKGPQIPNIQPTITPMHTTTTKSNNYYKVEVASQTISAGLAPKDVKEEYYVKEEPHYKSLTYGYHPYYKTDDSKSESYLHHTEATGVQHLSEDGTETSAYGDENVSIKPLNRTKRSELETEPFLVDEKTSTEASITANISDTPTSESLIRLNPFNKKRANDFQVFLPPSFPVGEATDYTDYDYPVKIKKPYQRYESIYEDDDYLYDDFTSPDYDFASSKYQNYAPSYQLESKGSFSNKIRHFRRPTPRNPTQFYGPPATSYGVPIYGASPTIFNPQNYIHAKFELPAVNTLSNFQSIIEPVYMLTQSQLKELIGHHNLNIEHLDVFQLPKGSKGKKIPHYPRRHRKRNPFRHVRNNLYKLHKFA